jgi:hypothetical protein
MTTNATAVRRAPKSRGSGDPSGLERWLKESVIYPNLDGLEKIQAQVYSGLVTDIDALQPPVKVLVDIIEVIWSTHDAVMAFNA